MSSVLAARLLWLVMPETVAMVVIQPLWIWEFLRAAGKVAIQLVTLLEVFPERPPWVLFSLWLGKVVRVD
ncbi:TPA: hypothetical protein MC539_005752 [Klebsiella oxytoca]|nr:hypothetical protein [Klebsiella oxytoca]